MVVVGGGGVEESPVPFAEGLFEVVGEREFVGVYIGVDEFAGIDEGPVLESA